MVEWWNGEMVEKGLDSASTNDVNRGILCFILDAVPG